VVGTTSSPWRLDNISGLPRSFENKIFVDLPNGKARGQLLRTLLQRTLVPHNFDSSDLDHFAGCAVGMSGGELLSVVEQVQTTYMTRVETARYFKPVGFPHQKSCNVRAN
jgi:SpoVK/Ycf46/Vps4 family AAA+-type ATPase